MITTLHHHVAIAAKDGATAALCHQLLAKHLRGEGRAYRWTVPERCALRRVALAQRFFSRAARKRITTLSFDDVRFV